LGKSPEKFLFIPFSLCPVKGEMEHGTEGKKREKRAGYEREVEQHVYLHF